MAVENKDVAPDVQTARASLARGGAPANLEYLARSAHTLSKVPLTGPIPNPTLWTMGANAYLDALLTWPEHEGLVTLAKAHPSDPDPPLDRLIATGDRILAGTHGIVYAGRRPNVQLLADVIDQYRFRFATVRRALGALRTHFQDDAAAGFDLWAPGVQHPRRDPALLVPSTLPACEGYARQDPLPRPDGLLAFVPPEVVMDKLLLNRGEVSYCYRVTGSRATARTTVARAFRCFGGGRHS